MQRRWQWLLRVLLLWAVSLSGCHEQQQRESTEANQKTQIVTITPEQQATIGLTTAQIVRQQVRPVIESFGRVIPRLQGRVQVTSPVAGRVTPQSAERIPSSGTVVRKGQVLAEVEQTYTASEQVQLGIGQESAGGTAQEAKAALDAAATEYQRSERLLHEKIVSRKRLEEAKAAWLQAQSRYETARRQEARYRTAITAGKESLQRFSLIAPINGVIVQADITAGQQVDTLTPLFTVADLSTVWVEAPVFEGDLDKIDNKSPVTIHGVGENRRSWTGQPIYTGDVVDPLKRTASLLYEVNNADGLLKLGMSVTIILPAGPQQQAVMVPEAALIEGEGGKGVVYIRQSSKVFTEQEVTVGIRREGLVAITGDVQAGEDVVVIGAPELFGTRPGRLLTEE